MYRPSSPLGQAGATVNGMKPLLDGSSGSGGGSRWWGDARYQWRQPPTPSLPPSLYPAGRATTHSLVAVIVVAAVGVSSRSRSTTITHKVRATQS